MWTPIAYVEVEANNHGVALRKPLYDVCGAMMLPARIKRMTSCHLRETRGAKPLLKFVIKRAMAIKIQLIQWML
jgi:hypothetical protein